jgi:transposase
MSVSLIRRELQNDKLVKCGKPKLETPISALQRRNRLTWVKLHEDDDWDNVYFTDEKTLRPCQQKYTKGYYYALRGNIVVEKIDRRVEGVMILCAISTKGKRVLQCYDGYVNALDYSRFIDTHIPHGSDLLHDNCKPHKNPRVDQILEDKEILDIMVPVPCSDLNPVEQVWSRLGKVLWKGNKVFHTKEALIEGIYAAWDIVKEDQAFIEAIVYSMTQRCAEVRRLRGGKSRY